MPARITRSCCIHCRHHGSTKRMIEIQCSSRHVSIQLLTCRLSLFQLLHSTEFHIGSIWLKCSTCRVTLLLSWRSLYLQPGSSQHEGHMLGVALQGCCNEHELQSCLDNSPPHEGCAEIEAEFKCIPDNGCCDLEVDVDGTKIKWRDLFDQGVPWWDTQGCTLTNPCR